MQKVEENNLVIIYIPLMFITFYTYVDFEVCIINIRRREGQHNNKDLTLDTTS